MMPLPKLDPHRVDEILEESRSRFKDAESAFALHANRLTESLAFYKGLQWGGHLTQSGDWQPDTGESRLVYDYMIPFVTSWVSTLLENPPNPSVSSAHSDLKGRARAKASKNLLRSLIRSGKISFEEILRGSIGVPIYGGGWYKTYWNPYKGKIVSETPVNADPESGEEYFDALGLPLTDVVWSGDIDFEFYDIFDVIPDIHAKRFRDIESVFCRKLMLISRLETEHPVDIFGESTRGRFIDYRSGYGQSERDLIEGDLAFGSRTESAGSALARIVEEWCPPSPRYPKGALIVWAGDVPINISPLPYRFPWTYHLGPNPTPNGFLAMGIVDPAKDIQRNINLISSKQLEVADVVINPHLLIPRGSDIEKSLFSDVPGRLIEFSPGLPPEWMPTPNIPSSFFQFNDQNIAIMKDLTGDSGISRGQIPQNVNSARSMAYMERFQKATNAPNVYLFQLVMKDIFTNALYLMRDFYEEGRLINLVGKNNQWSMVPFKSEDYDFDCELVVEPFSGVPTSKMVKQATIMDGLTQGLLSDTPEARRARQLLEIESADDDESLEPDYTHDFNRACEEDLLVLQYGELAPLEVLPQDHDPTHLRQHRQFSVSPEYFAMLPEARQFHDMHRQLHEEQQLVKENFMNQQAMGAMPPGQNPQAGKASTQPRFGSHGANDTPALDNPLNESPDSEPNARGPAVPQG